VSQSLLSPSKASPSRRTPDFAADLLRENEQRRADVVSTVANVAKERDALLAF
jgi:hypothetical protein